MESTSKHLVLRWQQVVLLLTTARGGSSPAFEGKASYEWSGDFGGKVWVSGISQRVIGLTNNVTTGTAPNLVTTNTAGNKSDTANAVDVGATVSASGFTATAYYNAGQGTGTTVQFQDGYDRMGNSRDSDDWYVQGTYTIPGVGTKLGVSYGESTLDGNAGADTFSEYKNTMWTVGAYHPLTKHLNLVAEYSDVRGEMNGGAAGDLEGTNRTVSAGAILFF